MRTLTTLKRLSLAVSCALALSLTPAFVEAYVDDEDIDVGGDQPSDPYADTDEFSPFSDTDEYDPSDFEPTDFDPAHIDAEELVEPIPPQFSPDNPNGPHFENPTNRPVVGFPPADGPNRSWIEPPRVSVDDFDVHELETLVEMFPGEFYVSKDLTLWRNGQNWGKLSGKIGTRILRGLTSGGVLIALAGGGLALVGVDPAEIAFYTGVEATVAVAPDDHEPVIRGMALMMWDIPINLVEEPVGIAFQYCADAFRDYVCGVYW